MLRIAVQSRGRLYDKAITLLEEIDIRLNRDKHILLLSAKGFPVEILFLRDGGIPRSIANGVADIDIAGENKHVEKRREAKLVKRLDFSKYRLSLAVPRDEEYKGAEWFEGKTIAAPYPVILRSFLEERGVKADIHIISDSVEITPDVGLADAIFDIVNSGSTLVGSQLREVEVALPCEALLVANNNLSREKLGVLDEFLFRFGAIQVAEDRKYVLLNAPKEKLDEIIEVLPGMKSPTITPLADDEWISVRSVIAEKHFWEVTGKLKSLGAEGILALPVKKMIV